jgi:hypothetical protein
LYSALISDYVADIILNSLLISPLLQSEYQEPINLTTLLTPELVFAFVDYSSFFIRGGELNAAPSIVFVASSGIINFYYGDGLVYFLFFFVYIYLFIYFFLLTSNTKKKRKYTKPSP